MTDIDDAPQRFLGDRLNDLRRVSLADISSEEAEDIVRQVYGATRDITTVVDVARFGSSI